MLPTSFFVVAMYRHNVLEAASIAVIASQRWQAVGPKFPTFCPPSIFQWLLCKHVHGGIQRQVVANQIQSVVAVRGSGHGGRTALPRGHVACV